MKRTRNMCIDNKVVETTMAVISTPTRTTIFNPTTKKRSVKPINAHKTKRILIREFEKDYTTSCSASSSLHKTPTESDNLTESKTTETYNSYISATDNKTDLCWRSLNVGTKELFLDLTFPTGQTFRWRETGPTCGPSEYTGVIGVHLFTLRQVGDEVKYFIHGRGGQSEEEQRAVLNDYLNLGISLKDMWNKFVQVDSRFAALAPYMGGARLLRQDPLECLFQFICSSNNNIKRITQMVEYLSSFGPYLGTVDGTYFHAFPSLKELSSVTEGQLRAAGFGYRAKYIVETVKALNSKNTGGNEWLLSLRNLPLEESMEALCTLPGVGPKVASCIALFSLDQHHAIPVDTHVWQIAMQYITPELSGEHLTPKLSQKVSEAFVTKFGKYAGWAQTVLFISELSSQQAILPQHLRTVKEPKVKTKHKKGSVKDRD
ncbi:hypothetical protein SUGI_0466040 [Cryptomeria japonica]|nr:hypothetical protein SUGI_0466040 [Cryptomeria japonica]